MTKYKNISKETLALIGVGLFKPNEVFETNKDINNPNFVEVGEQKVDEKKEEEIKIKKVK